jgi:sorbitol-specific phosphotransferase system component IIC
VKPYFLLVAGLFLAANGAALLMYRGVVRGSYLFVTAGTVLLPLAVADFLLSLVVLIAFVWDITRRRKKS